MSLQAERCTQDVIWPAGILRRGWLMFYYFLPLKAALKTDSPDANDGVFNLFLGEIYSLNEKSTKKCK